MQVGEGNKSDNYNNNDSSSHVVRGLKKNDQIRNTSIIRIIYRDYGLPDDEATGLELVSPSGTR